ncbi:MAG: DUF488 family protein [Verrucomicrobiota bacterium]
MLYKRQKLLLDLVHAAGGELAATDLQKLLFLYVRQCEAEPSYKFVPYKYGCFSFQSYADRSVLERKGMLYEAEDGQWTLTPKASTYLDPNREAAFTHFLTQTVPERGDALVERIYRLEPYYATRSKILDRVISDKKDQKTIKSAQPKSTNEALFTIGYEGDSIDGYLNRLIHNNVRLLCDVRRNPLSRKTGFSKRQLESYCRKVDIEYSHLPELGIPSHRRRRLESMADYQTLFAEYRAEDLPEARHAIEELGKLLKKYKRIALTCFEKEHECCHRHCVADEMHEILNACPAPQHI